MIKLKKKRFSTSQKLLGENSDRNFFVQNLPYMRARARATYVHDYLCVACGRNNFDDDLAYMIGSSEHIFLVVRIFRFAVSRDT